MTCIYWETDLFKSRTKWVHLSDVKVDDPWWKSTVNHSKSGRPVYTQVNGLEWRCSNEKGGHRTVQFFWSVYLQLTWVVHFRIYRSLSFDRPSIFWPLIMTSHKWYVVTHINGMSLHLRYVVLRFSISKLNYQIISVWLWLLWWPKYDVSMWNNGICIVN